jgi:ribonuclease-3 family protein
MTSTAALAYLGDAVFELRVREMLLKQNPNGIPISELNRLSRNYVTATAQSAMYHAVFDMLSEEEQDIMKRGRNLHSNSRAKSADVIAYRHATGLETLFGYLYEKNALGRIDELFNMCISTNKS